MFSFHTLHQIVSLTGINFNTRSIIGFVELTIVPSKDNLKDIRLNAKQCKIYKVILNGKIEPVFQYGDPMLEVCKEDSNIRDLDTYAKTHFEECSGVDPDLNRGELSVVIPKEAKERGFIKEGKPLKVGIEFSLESPHGGIHFVLPEKESESEKNKKPQPTGTQIKEKTMAEKASHLFTASHENSSRLWFPCVDSFSEICTWKLEFTVDESMTAISCGELLEVVYTPDLKRKTFHYSLNIPTAAPNIGLAVGPFEIYVDPNMHEVTHFCLPHLLPLLKFTSKWLHECIVFFESNLRTRFPYSCYKQVFVDESYSEFTCYASMSILNTSLLTSSAVIDQVYLTRKVMAETIACQFYGCYIDIDRWSDRWLKKGLSMYLMGLYIKKTFGNNEYRFMIHQEMDKVVKYEEKHGGIVLDRSMPPQNLPPMRGEAHKIPKIEENSFAFSPDNLNTASPEFLEAMAMKAHIVIRMLESRLVFLLFFFHFSSC